MPPPEDGGTVPVDEVPERKDVVLPVPVDEVPERKDVVLSDNRVHEAPDNEDPDEWRFHRSPPSSNACAVPELYVFLGSLCEGYPEP